jgi:hypothetical protein
MLSAAQMAQMNRLLDEALDLDSEGRRRWLEALAPEYEDLKAALRKALFPREGQASGAEAVATLPKVGAAPGAIGRWASPSSDLSTSARLWCPRRSASVEHRQAVATRFLLPHSPLLQGLD